MRLRVLAALAAAITSLASSAVVAGAQDELPPELEESGSEGESEPDVADEVVSSEAGARAGELDAPPDLVAEAPSNAPPRRVEERDVVSSSPRTLLGPDAAMWLEVGMSGSGRNRAEAVLLSPEIGVRYRLADAVVAEVSWGLTYGATHVRGDAVIAGMTEPYDQGVQRVQPGNPTLGGAFVHRGSGALVEVGLSMSLPTASRAELGADVDSAAERASSELVNRSAMSMRGYRGAFRWAPERFSLAIPLRVVLPIEALTIEIDGALAVMFPVLGDRGVDVDAIIELGAGAGATVYGPLAAGVRLGGVGAAMGVSAPDFTLSAEPWLRLRFDPVQLTARGVLNLSGQDGLGQGRGPAWGVFVGAGVEI